MSLKNDEFHKDRTKAEVVGGVILDCVRKSIIYVDDIHFNLVTVKDRLKRHYEVTIAQSVDKVFKVLEHFNECKRTNPDLILLDLNKPEVDGFEVIKKLKSEAYYAQIPVIFLSSKHDINTMATAMDLGAADFFAKPFSDSSLIDLIEYQLDPEKFDANRPIVLAVDDNPSILMSVKHLLSDKYKVYLLQEPLKIKELLRRITPDIFLLDCLMPGINGFELVPVIRDIIGHEETPIIFLTSGGTIDNFSTAINSGASDFIVKPINGKILREKTAIQLHRYIMRRNIWSQ